MKKILKGLIKQTAPGLVERYKTITANIEQLAHSMDELRVLIKATKQQINQTEKRIEEILEHTDRRLDNLKKLASKVEPYQPTYGVEGIIESPKRNSYDRAQTILDSFDKDMRGYSVLDLGSSFGYMAFFLSERGASVEAWESLLDNHKVAKATQNINGISAKLRHQELNPKTIQEITAGSFDVVLGLSIFHHIIYDYGLKETQKIINDLLNKIPVLIVELAQKGEDPDLHWDSAQPKNPLDIFKGIDVKVEELGQFSNHLSPTKRSLYKVSKNYLEVSGKKYIVQHTSRKAYNNPPPQLLMQRREYITTADYFIKKYSFNDKKQENKQQIINEINFFSSLSQLNKHHPLLVEMVDFEINAKEALIVFKRLRGRLAEESEALVENHGMNRVVIDLLKLLAFLQNLGYYHNDVRSWNIIITKERAMLIDFGLASHIPTEDSAVALLWALHAIKIGERESYEQAKTVLPPAKDFSDNAALKELYQAVSAGDRSFSNLMKLIDKNDKTKK